MSGSCSIADWKCRCARPRSPTRERFLAQFVLEERQDRLVARLRVGPAQRDELLANAVRVRPLVLLLVQLLQVEQRVLVRRIHADHFVERFERAIDEAAALEVEAEAQQDVGVLDLGQLGALQLRLVHLDGARDLAALAMHVAEDQVNLERVAVDARRLAQLLDRQVDLVGDEEIQAQHVVMRIAGAAPIDPLAVAQLVALPRLADGQAERAA